MNPTTTSCSWAMSATKSGLPSPFRSVTGRWIAPCRESICVGTNFGLLQSVVWFSRNRISPVVVRPNTPTTRSSLPVPRKSAACTSATRPTLSSSVIGSNVPSGLPRSHTTLPQRRSVGGKLPRSATTMSRMPSLSRSRTSACAGCGTLASTFHAGAGSLGRSTMTRPPAMSHAKMESGSRSMGAPGAGNFTRLTFEMASFGPPAGGG